MMHHRWHTTIYLLHDRMMVSFTFFFYFLQPDGYHYESKRKLDR